MSFRLLSLVLTASLVLTGCTSQAPDAPAATLGASSVDEMGARVVVALVDSGINPYHVEFRDDSPEAWIHPSTYLAGFPADAPALNLTFDAPDYESAVLADCEVWLSVEPRRLYWIPGTRIVGAITFLEQTQDGGLLGESYENACEPDNLPFILIDGWGHGTMVASRAAGATYSLCPECRILAVQGYESEIVLWTSEQPYVDVQSNSWGAFPVEMVTGRMGFSPNDAQQVREAAGRHAVFVAGGNGLAGFFGGVGHPAHTDVVAGAAGVVMVGGHDGGRYTPWTMTMPHVVADAMMHPAAHHDSLDEGDERTGGGTSGATPFAAGAFARVVLEARRLLGDTGTGVRDGSFVVPAPGAVLPAEGPLSDGRLEIEEAKMLFFHTANPRPVRDGAYDGPGCGVSGDAYQTAICLLFPTTPVEWGVVPEGVPAYYFVGYGQVGALTLNATLAALRGEAPIPERPVEDAFFGLDAAARETLN